MGFHVNKMSNFYFDKLSYAPLKCISENMQKAIKKGVIPYEMPRDFKPAKIWYMAPYCSRYHMNYKLKMSLNWVEVNHESLSRGPPEWRVEKKYNKRDYAITQEKKIYSSLSDQPGAILLLDY